MASGQNFPDALAAAPLATRDGAALLLVEPDLVPDVVATELTLLNPSGVVVLGGRAAVSDQVMIRLGQISGTPAARLAGADRYHTAATDTLRAVFADLLSTLP